MIMELLNVNVNKEKWNDWRWQMGQKAICSNPANLKESGLLTDIEQVEQISLTPYNVNLLLELKEKDPEGFRAEWLQSFARPTKTKKHQWAWAKRHDLPSSKLSRFLPRFLRTLFWGRGSDTEVKGLENIYPKTDVLIVSAVCARHCAHCFREVGDPEGEAAQMTGGMGTVMQAVNEIIKRGTPHVLVTGGDPLSRPNQQLKQILTPFVESNTTEVVRLATRMIVDLPMRFFDVELLEMLTRFAERMRERNASLRIVTHINHPCELTEEAIKAIRNLQQCEIELLNQAVVLRGVNDNVPTLRKLFMELDGLQVRPYKILHTMPVEGTEHLRVPLRKFRKLLAGLHQWLPGTSVPQANAATLIGKMPISPSGRYMISIPFTRRVLIRNWLGEWHFYKDVKDWLRRLREAAVASLLIVVLGIMLLWPHQAKNTDSLLLNLKSIERISVLADELNYPEAWARQHFEPYIQEGTLYVPVNMRM